MKIQILESITGLLFSFARGEIVEVSPEFGQSLINANQAKLIEPDSEEVATPQEEVVFEEATETQSEPTLTEDAPQETVETDVKPKNIKSKS